MDAVRRRRSGVKAAFALITSKTGSSPPSRDAARASVEGIEDYGWLERLGVA